MFITLSTLLLGVKMAKRFDGNIVTLVNIRSLLPYFLS